MYRKKLDKSFYFITCSTFLHEKIFIDEYKEILLNNILEKIKLFGKLFMFSIAKNHYHILIYLNNNEDLSKFMQQVNGKTGFEINKIRKVSGRIWDKYWSNIILSEDIFYKIVGYIAGNLLKHKEVGSFDELYNIKFSSYRFLVEQKDGESAKEIVKSVIELDIETKKEFSRLKSGK